jgi:hypothetical protein
VQLVSATPIERVTAFTDTPRRFNAAASAPASAAAPSTFSTTTVPATPRRPVPSADLSTATSSSTMSVSAPHISDASEKFMTSPA